ncbi:YesL family protein [Cellulomonas soli]|uniref:YesL family protein n=1 Tax=Cellulomonas soli TaxID=931535 RepID=UPI003F847C23
MDEHTEHGGPAPARRGRVAVPIVADDPAVGWAGRAMTWLRYATLLVGINVLIALGTLAGGVLLGLFPALGAGGALLASLAAGAPPAKAWSTFWALWRHGWRRHNLLGTPVWVVLLLLTLDASALQVLDGPAAAVLTGGLVVVSAYALVALAFLFPVARRYETPAVRTWRFVAAAPLVSPGTAVAVLVTLAAIALVIWTVPVLGPLVGVSLPLLASGWLVDHRLDTLDAR